MKRNPNATSIQDNNESPSTTRNPSLTLIYDVARNPNPKRIQDVIRNHYPPRIEDSMTYNGSPMSHPHPHYRYICIHITFAFTYMLIDFKNKLVLVVK